jgi:hypothetical protein
MRTSGPLSLVVSCALACLLATALSTGTGCKKSSAEGAGEPGVGSQKPDPNKAAEVEFTGEWKSSVTAKTYYFVLQKDPCQPMTANTTTYGATSLAKPGPLFAEFFVPQGTLAHVCLFAKDEAGKVVGVASYDKNPVRLEGRGEIVVGPLSLIVAGF